MVNERTHVDGTTLETRTTSHNKEIDRDRTHAA